MNAMLLQREQETAIEQNGESARPSSALGGGILSLVRSQEQIAVELLEAENSGLRRMVVELLEKNQRLREQILSVAV